MYLNEKAWSVEENNKYEIISGLKSFLDIYSELIYKYKVEGIYVPDTQERAIRSKVYPLEKWLAETDIEYRRRFLSFWNKRMLYHPEDEYEFLYKGERLEGATEAVLNDSFIISPCIGEKWRQIYIDGTFISLPNDTDKHVSVLNIYEKEQLGEEESLRIIRKNVVPITIVSYEQLWIQKERIFPNLEFCPSVEKNLQNLQLSYINQIIRKLSELDKYCEKYKGMPFDNDQLSKTTVETGRTLKQFKKEHTFYDKYKVPYLASWHMRFTGIPGRIFFVPQYKKQGKEEKILICYIGSKLENATYN